MAKYRYTLLVPRDWRHYRWFSSVRPGMQ